MPDDAKPTLSARILEAFKSLLSLAFVGWVASTFVKRREEPALTPMATLEAPQEVSSAASDTASTEDEPPSESRRRFLTLMIGGLGTVMAGAVGTPVVAFVLSPLFKKSPDVWRPVGTPTQFPVGQSTKVNLEDPSSLPWSGVASETAAWLTNKGGGSYVAFSINCTHLGCPVRWEDAPRLYMCPCHGGVFYEDGRVAGGPPPQPLTRLDVRESNGQVEIHTRGLNLTGGLNPGSSNPQ